MLWLAVFCVTKGLLDALPNRAGNDSLMDVFMDFPIFFGVIQPLFELVGFGVGAEVDDVAHIGAVHENLLDDALVPQILAAHGLFCRVFEALALRVERRDQQLFALEDVRDFVDAFAVLTHGVDMAHVVGGLIIHDPPFGTTRQAARLFAAAIR